MATYILDGKASASLPRRPLTVTMSTSGSSGTASARLAARRRTGDHEPTAIMHSAAMLILPRVDDEVVVVAVPDGGRSRFDDGTTLHVSIGPDSGVGYDVDLAQLTPRDVSGLSFIELATVAPAGADTLLVTTRLAIPDAPLSPLGAQARVACRGVLRVDQMHESATRQVVCVVDTSLSMAASVVSGDVAAAGDIVAGLAAVVSGSSGVDLVIAGAEPQRRRVEGAELGGALSVIPPAGFGVGADLVAALGDPVEPTLTVVITDDAGAALLAGSMAQASTSSRNLITAIVLSDSVSARRRAGFVGAVVPPGRGDRRAELAAAPERVRQIVADVIGPFFGGDLP
ncbi:hypothetical protein GOEFS_096_00810 [Gordonia effusa NBRC 100432]|uniref:Uncharacterized protein n=1 Tax=Gordonia effusa NBRC 100432 TaxID=1077974 RepID=H0R4A3_9ACTN|nr:hypothetical protein [Gordonia effusa]GAB19904.1 hypothetical protein GOEFS_096_00810 [Gordonia effusa NBRC 100432]